MEKLILQSDKLHLTPFIEELTKLVAVQREMLANPKGNPLKYTLALEKLPEISSSCKTLNNITVTAGSRDDLLMMAQIKEDISDKYSSNRTDESYLDKIQDNFKANLMQLAPWRKGPFELFGIKIDSEWQSWIKWNRFIDKIAPLTNRRILDIGSSNGYYMFRMAAFNPKMVLGLEPQYAFYFQYLALQKYLNLDNIFCLPIPFDELPNITNYFDTVFCMGVLYHRKSPLDMLKKINDLMKRGGELVLETLIIEAGDNEHICLFPEDRYAKMRNVFFIPTIKVLESWLKRTGFGKIKCLDISRTESEEQRKTKWIQTESLTDFLDPENPSKTVEGYPAPVRAIVSAHVI
ncbi:MAG: tRNA 5-methoxyuridine(34)/uridine 5-oxyacetic acid(34) synthase CmoB [Desulfamplus sp.]|nr:tRNA 5-methoxyuridine(34)/uridine 5-oxyacetic acid(34) synthase CmoB [Desulfamplus sp.]